MSLISVINMVQCSSGCTWAPPMLFLELSADSAPPGKPARSGKSIAAVSAFLYHLL